MTSLKEDVRRSAMLCILTVPATMTSHDLMKFVASFYEVIEHMKIIRDSTPNQYMVLIKFSSQVRAGSPFAIEGTAVPYRCWIGGQSFPVAQHFPGATDRDLSGTLSCRQACVMFCVHYFLLVGYLKLLSM